MDMQNIRGLHTVKQMFSDTETEHQVNYMCVCVGSNYLECLISAASWEQGKVIQPKVNANCTNKFSEAE